MLTTIEQNLHQPFVYGVLDCGMFALRAALERIENPELDDLLRQSAQAYSTEIGGHRVLLRWMRSKGIPTDNPYENIVTYFLGDPIARLQAKTGDICIGDWGEGISFGVVEGYRIVCVSETGLIRLPLAKAQKVWRCG